VLDVGAGTGNVAIAVAATGRRVTAVDTSPAMLARLRAKLESAASSLSILEESAAELDALPDESFDGITILLSLYDMDEPRRALEQAIRLLRAGGILVVTEPRRAFALAPILAEVERVLKSKSLWPALARDWQRVRDVNVELDPSPGARARRAGRLFLEDIGALLEERGFAIASTRDSHLGNCATIVATKPAVARSAGLARARMRTCGGDAHS
jgi:SAM-dependent methyltransferase